MSASLVGSEMCIRDSFAGTQPTGSLLANPPITSRAGRPRGDPAAGLKPVSYTHLTLPTICSV
eukprot:10301255-Alexandrium_andersonii.AAC.1